MVVMDMDVLDTKTNTKTKTNTTCFKDPMYAIFLKISGFKDFKYDMDMSDMDVVDPKTNTKTQTQTNTMCFKNPM